MTLKTSHFSCGAKRALCYSSSGSDLHRDDQGYEKSGISFTHQRLAKLNTSDYEFFDSNNKDKIYAHIYFCKSGFQPSPNSQNLDQLRIYKRHELTVFQDEGPKVSRFNLFEGLMRRGSGYTEYESDQTVSDTNIHMVKRYWKPSISINLVTNVPPFSRKDIPIYLRQHGYFFDRDGNLFSPVYINEFWVQPDHFLLLNSSVENISHI